MGFLPFFSAQDFNNYTPLVSSGTIPKDFTENISERATLDIKENVDFTQSYQARKDQSDFLLKTNYMIDELLMSGRVLFGDPVSQYVNTVADKLLKNDPELRKELRFYCLKSNVTNAFSTNQGMIFVTLGLIAQLENEAQLAQVLSHEIVHYTKKHVINTFIESSRISQGKGQYKYNSYDDNIIQLSNYSKTLEFEADSIGFFRLKNAGYAIEEALSVFDILQFSYLPFDEEPFDYRQFETEKVKIPEVYKLDSILPIRFEDDYDDSKSSHPNIKKRREKIIELIQNQSGGKLYIQSEELFKKIQTISRFEGVRLNNKNANYVKAIYNAQLLLKDYPNNDFLERNVIKALYGISKYKMQDKTYTILGDYDSYEGEISAAYYFFEQLSNEQVASIALEKINTYYLNNNQDENSKKIMQNLILDLVDNGVGIKDYYELKKEDTTATKDTTVNNDKAVTANTTSKYAKLRAIKKKQEQAAGTIKTEDDRSRLFHHEYLYSSPNITELEAFFKEAKNQLSNDEEPTTSYVGMPPYEVRRAVRREKKAAKNQDYHEKIQTNKIVFVDPDYLIIDERKGQKLENAEKKKYDFYQQLELTTQKIGLEYEILSPKVFTENDVEKYNDLARINDWVGEKMMHDDNIKKTVFISAEHENVKELYTKYNTEHFVYTGVLQYKEKKRDLGYVLPMTIIFWPALPYGIYYAATPLNFTYYYNIWYNINEDKETLRNLRVLKTKANKGNINSIMYHTLNKVK
jgi:predicted Zn-dependent protease